MPTGFVPQQQSAFSVPASKRGEFPIRTLVARISPARRLSAVYFPTSKMLAHARRGVYEPCSGYIA